MKSRLAIVGAVALAAAISAQAAESQRMETIAPMCDGSGSLVIVYDIDAFAKGLSGLVETAVNGKDTERKQFVELLKSELCARRGPHSGAWLLAGTQESMDMGVIPYSQGSGLFVAKPRHTVIQLLEVRFEPK